MRGKIGIPAAELGTAQRDLLWQLVDTYSVIHLTPALAAAQKARVRSGDADAVHFAWYGANTPEKAFGYRVIGDGFVIEMGSVDAAAQHLHTIYHDLGNVLGRDRVDSFSCIAASQHRACTVPMRFCRSRRRCAIG